MDSVLNFHAQICQDVGIFLQVEECIIAGWRDLSRVPLVSTIKIASLSGISLTAVNITLDLLAHFL